ncbi:hypothetical protein BB559_000326 [Furculomyces boomerangus]|uniref:Uncharacterized protein n=1 Tax=Furculomyces boomerangus TaxID=61424 RepID=A0A2T9Z424_9FUNG|nr:hypothetical protein BB559_000835 [Furculomyces boomerangus]PVU99877.1 hypothetical protein BB559_000326 [Furculomyces boomerangus]
MRINLILFKVFLEETRDITLFCLATAIVMILEQLAEVLMRFLEKKKDFEGGQTSYRNIRWYSVGRSVLFASRILVKIIGVSAAISGGIPVLLSMVFFLGFCLLKKFGSEFLLQNAYTRAVFIHLLYPNKKYISLTQNDLKNVTLY